MNKSTPRKNAGIIHKISLENFLCHDKLEMEFNEQINFVIGKNGSGKSAVLTGIVVALGERASATSRGQSIKDFIKTGKSKAVVRVTLVNKGEGSYQRETYGDFITIERTINAGTGSGGYRILNEQGRLVSNKRGDLNRILAKMNLQVDNPVCILNQETAKNFLHSNDAQAKYKLFERATQMDVMRKEFSNAEDELSRSKSCMKEKLQSLELLKNEVKKWHTKKQWYESINEIQEKKAKLENEIAWAQVEDHEKKSAAALELRDNQMAQMEKTRRRIEEHEEKLTNNTESIRTRNTNAAEKADEVRAARAEGESNEKKLQELKKLKDQLVNEIRLLETDKRRAMNNKEDLVKEIDKLKKSHGDSEYDQRRERRIAELESLKTKHEALCSVRKVCEHQVEQLRGALRQLNNEIGAARSEHLRTQRASEQKVRMVNELRNAESSSYAVFGDWVAGLLQKIERTPFRGAKPKGPIGAYIKLKEKSWAPIVENFFGNRLHNFICSNDDDTKILNRLLDDTIPRGRARPNIITSSMIGKLHDVHNYKVQCNDDLQSRDIHCLMDMLIIEDPDIANILIDLHSIEQVLLIRDERDARHLLADSNRVPYNCKSAITKEGNTYFPDPNYRSYAGKVPRAAHLLQASVEDAIRNLEDEIDGMQKDVERTQNQVSQITIQVKENENQLRMEEAKLSNTKRELATIGEKIRTLENQTEPEPTDVLALEEDLLDVQQKLDKIESDKSIKMATFNDTKAQLKEVTDHVLQRKKVIDDLVAQLVPLKDSTQHYENKQRELKEAIDKLTAQLTNMQGKLKEFETDYVAAKQKAESEAAIAEQLCVRVPVTKSLKTLNAELRQIKEQVAAQEKEYGSRDYVLGEYQRYKADFERANSEVANAQRSLKKMTSMAKQRKAFISRFRNSIESRTHHVFQALLKTRNFEGEILFDCSEKSLILMVTPPGRENSSQPTPKRSRMSVSNVTDIRTLSGGERSFATVCFVLSLWDAIESPFRILDEFDVFMDHVNRSISMDLLIAEARENAGRQFIFLTPLGLEKQQLRSVDMAIFKMADPDRRDENAT